MTYTYRVRLEFDVEVDNPSHIDAAFAAADWLQDRARESRLSYLVYETQQHGDESGQWYETDLEDIEPHDERDDGDDVMPDLSCAECGNGEAETYVVTYLDGDQHNRYTRTEICIDCHRDLALMEASDR
ncbi:hypothetical protein ACFWGP_05475 [Agromyces sp. NPDC127015]|uniref:hypothetical protein n=1 Tax=Agromyces sp. NPDC127015 TaxID=3347108 RepID=UPI0036536CCF